MVFFEKRSLNTFFIFSLTVIISGCGTLFGENGVFPSRVSDYLESEESAPIETPPGIDGKDLTNAYPIPDLEYASVLPDKFSVPRVESISDVESKGAIRIQTLADDRWILVNRAPTQTWPLIVGFLRNNNIGIAVEDADGGIIETDWLKDADRTEDFREKYRYIFRSGVQQNTTEVLIKQMNSSAVDAANFPWTKSSDSDRESSMATTLGQFLASSPQEVSHSLLAQGLTTANKANLAYTSAGQPYIALQLPFQRGWASLGLALERADFKVTDKNHDNGFYYANFEPSSQRRQTRRSWFSRLAFWRANKKDDEIRGQYKVIISPESNQSAGDAGVLSVEIKSDTDRQLQNNEQAYLLNRILVKLS